MVDRQYGLRERKHLETRARLQNSAIELVMKNGLEKTTVDAISKLANVSPRTFFNYFDSKEDVILGLHKGGDFKYINQNELGFDENIDIKGRVIDLLLSMFNPILANQDLHKKVMKLVRKYPQLLEKKVSHISKLNEQIMGATKQIIMVEYPEMDDLTASTSAQIVSILCVGGVKIAMKEWMSTKKALSLKLIKQRAMEVVSEAQKIL